MKHLWYLLRTWLGEAEKNRWLVRLNSKIERLLKEKRALEALLTASDQRLNKLRDKIAVETKNQRQLLERADEMIQKLERQLDATAESLKTANEITIPGLVACNMLFNQRMEAEITNLQARQVLLRKDTD